MARPCRCLTHTSFTTKYCTKCGSAVAQLVEALRYKPERRGFDSRWCHWNFSLTFMCRLSRNLGASTSWNPQGIALPFTAQSIFLLHVPATFCSHHEGDSITQTWAACCTLTNGSIHISVVHNNQSTTDSASRIMFGLVLSQ
jgi:hypothetical protein